MSPEEREELADANLHAVENTMRKICNTWIVGFDGKLWSATAKYVRATGQGVTLRQAVRNAEIFYEENSR